MSESDREKLLKLRGVVETPEELERVSAGYVAPVPTRRPMTEAEEKLIELVVQESKTRRHWSQTDPYDQAVRALMMERTARADIEEMKRLSEEYEKAYKAFRDAQDRVPPMCR